MMIAQIFSKVRCQISLVHINQTFKDLYCRLMHYLSIGPKLFWTVQIILDRPNYFGRIQIGLDGPKSFWLGQVQIRFLFTIFYNLYLSKMI